MYIDSPATLRRELLKDPEISSAVRTVLRGGISEQDYQRIRGDLVGRFAERYNEGAAEALVGVIFG